VKEKRRRVTDFAARLRVYQQRMQSLFGKDFAGPTLLILLTILLVIAIERLRRRP